MITTAHLLDVQLHKCVKVCGSPPHAAQHVVISRGAVAGCSARQCERARAHRFATSRAACLLSRQRKVGPLSSLRAAGQQRMARRHERSRHQRGLLALVPHSATACTANLLARPRGTRSRSRRAGRPGNQHPTPLHPRQRNEDKAVTLTQTALMSTPATRERRGGAAVATCRALPRAATGGAMARTRHGAAAAAAEPKPGGLLRSEHDHLGKGRGMSKNRLERVQGHEHT